jgi:hypothetical protein
MPSSSSAYWPPRPASSAARPDPDLRLSDGDRAAIADSLARHYSEGRLNQADFSERLDRAWRARTQSDLTGLLADLPGTGEAARPARPRRHRYPLPGLLLLIAAGVVVWTALAWAVLVQTYLPWLVVGLLALLLLRYLPWHGHRR